MWHVVYWQVLALDEDEGKLSLTLRPSDLKLLDTASEDVPQTILSSFQEYISERAAILEEMKACSAVAKRGALSALARVFVPGGRVLGRVTVLTDDSAVVELQSARVTGKINRASMHGV